MGHSHSYCADAQAELKQQGWSDSLLESLRYLLAPQQEVEERQGLDPIQYLTSLVKYRELPHIMTPWKAAASKSTEQHMYQVSVLQGYRLVSSKA